MYYLIAFYIAGYLVSFMMQRTELAAEKEVYTFGSRLLIAATSLLSWLLVLIILAKTWIDYIRSTGFWDEAVTKPAQPPVIIEQKINSGRAGVKTSQN